MKKKLRTSLLAMNVLLVVLLSAILALSGFAIYRSDMINRYQNYAGDRRGRFPDLHRDKDQIGALQIHPEAGQLPQGNARPGVYLYHSAPQTGSPGQYDGCSGCRDGV